MSQTVSDFFCGVEDPRVQSRCLHLLEDMVEFGEQRLSWLEEVLVLPNGILSHDTFNRVLQLIDPDQLSVCLASDGQNLIEERICASVL